MLKRSDPRPCLWTVASWRDCSLRNTEMWGGVLEQGSHVGFTSSWLCNLLQATSLGTLGLLSVGRRVLLNSKSLGGGSMKT